MMNIYALEGHKVTPAVNLKGEICGGYDSDQKKVKEHLEIGKEYTILYTVVDHCRTDVKLKEFPNMNFNSASLEDVTEQPSEDNKYHQDWSRYHTKEGLA